MASYCKLALIVIIVLMVDTSISLPNTCEINTFLEIVQLYIKRGERWKDPHKMKHDLREMEWNKREELFMRLLVKYCEDPDVDENLILDLDHCFNLAFHVDEHITDECRHKLFKNAAEVKMSECSEDGNKVNDEFRDCIISGMRKIDPKYDMYHHAKTNHDKGRHELHRWLHSKPLKCLRKVLKKYLRESQQESRWPLWGSTLKWTEV